MYTGSSGAESAGHAGCGMRSDLVSGPITSGHLSRSDSSSGHPRRSLLDTSVDATISISFVWKTGEAAQAKSLDPDTKV